MKYKIKRFSKEAILSDNRWIVSSEYEVKVYIEESNVFKNDLSKNPGVAREVSNLRKDLKKGFLYTDGPNGGRTHFVGMQKKDQVQRVSEYLQYTKDLNYFDRLVYLVYKPQINKEAGLALIKVVLFYCDGHTKASGKKYSSLDE